MDDCILHPCNDSGGGGSRTRVLMGTPKASTGLVPACMFRSKNGAVTNPLAPEFDCVSLFPRRTMEQASSGFFQVLTPSEQRE